MDIQIVYVLTTDGHDAHANLNLVSAISARLHNPNAKIVLVCDQESVTGVMRASHKICDVVDSIQVVAAPSGTAGFRNRFVKTRMRQAIEGSFLYLDADTIVRNSLAFSDFRNCDMASAPNHSGTGDPSEIPDGELSIFAQMGWDTPSRWYVNGGVHFFKDNARVHRFFDEWHKRWQYCSLTTGMHYDQPSLNAALNSCDLRFQWLPHGWNAQIHARPYATRNATIWHFYTSDHHPSPLTYVDRFLARMNSGAMIDERDVWKLTRREHPWVIRNPVSAIAVHRILQQNSMLYPKQWERLWLAGHFGAVLRAMCRRCVVIVHECLLFFRARVRRFAGRLCRSLSGD